MKVYIDKLNLEQATNTTAKAVGGGVHELSKLMSIYAENNNLRLKAFDGELTIIVNCECETLDNSKEPIFVDGKLFSETIKKLPSGEVELGYYGSSLMVVHQKGKVNLPIVSATDIHQDTLDLLGKVEINSQDFKEIKECILPFTSKDDTRPLLKGINLQAENGFLTATALDGYKLAKKVYKVGESAKLSATIPTMFFSVVASELKDGDKIEIGFTNKHIIVNYENIQFISVVYQGEYVDTTRIIPISFKTRVEVNKQEFMKAIERCLLVKNNHCVCDLVFSVDDLDISAKTELGSVDEQIAIVKQGDGANISLNGNYLISALKGGNEETIVMELNESNAPMVITNSGITYLILPIRKNS